MKMKKNKIRVTSAVVSAIMLASSASAFAKFDAYNDSDGFTLGHYEAEVNQEQRADNCMSKDQKMKDSLKIFQEVWWQYREKTERL
jgi:hypothetical protein